MPGMFIAWKADAKSIIIIYFDDLCIAVKTMEEAQEFFSKLSEHVKINTRAIGISEMR